MVFSVGNKQIDGYFFPFYSFFLFFLLLFRSYISFIASIFLNFEEDLNFERFFLKLCTIISLRKMGLKLQKFQYYNDLILFFSFCILLKIYFIYNYAKETRSKLIWLIKEDGILKGILGKYCYNDRYEENLLFHSF